MSITWWSNDSSTDLAPGASLGGFSISSPGASNVLGNADVNSWDHNAECSGAKLGDHSGGDSFRRQVPEPWTGSTVGLSLLVGSFWLRKKSRRGPVPRLTAF